MIDLDKMDRINCLKNIFVIFYENIRLMNLHKN
jgi:hypothetical protein